MSKKHQRRTARGVNAPPNITLFGDNLDRLCNAVPTREVLNQAAKQALLDTPQSFLPDSAQPTHTPFIPKNDPIVCTMFRNLCRCGESHYTYGFLSRKIVEVLESGTVERYATVADNTPEPPSSYIYRDQIIPYCPICVCEKENVNHDRINFSGTVTGYYSGTGSNLNITDRARNPNLS